MPYFIIIRGPLGCGKTTVAQKIAQKLNAKYFDIDEILDSHGLTTDIEDGYVSQKSFLRANKIILPEAKDNLAKDTSVIFDGNFYWKSQIDDLTEHLNFPHYVFTLQAPLEVCIERDKNRNTPHGEDATKAVHTKTTEFDYGTIIDATRPLEKIIEEIISHLPRVE